MRLDTHIAKLEERLNADPDYCHCLEGWRIVEYDQGADRPEVPDETCHECGLPRGVMFIVRVTKKGKYETE